MSSGEIQRRPMVYISASGCAVYIPYYKAVMEPPTEPVHVLHWRDSDLDTELECFMDTEMEDGV